MAKRSPRTQNKGKLAQAGKFLDSAANSFHKAVEPYFERYPAKEENHNVIMDALAKLQDAILSQLNDV